MSRKEVACHCAPAAAAAADLPGCYGERESGEGQEEEELSRAAGLLSGKRNPGAEADVEEEDEQPEHQRAASGEQRRTLPTKSPGSDSEQEGRQPLHHHLGVSDAGVRETTDQERSMEGHQTGEPQRAQPTEAPATRSYLVRAFSCVSEGKLAGRPKGGGKQHGRMLAERISRPPTLEGGRMPTSMRSPEVAEAIPKLVEKGLLAPDAAAPLLRSARGELLSVRGELRALLYFGVLAVVAGVSLLVKENLERIGPVTIAAAIGVAAAACLFWALSRALPFSWQRAESSDWSFDFLLLLGILLLGADLAYIEAKFTPLGDAWSYHLLFMSLVTGALAVRCDSRTSWSLALSTFAAWRGVAATTVAGGLAGGLASSEGVLRLNLMLCGLAFVAAGFAMRRFDLKRHFEPLTTFLGCLGLLAGLASLALDPAENWILWAIVFVAAAAGLAAVALKARRFGLFALGALGVYGGVTRLAFELIGEAGCGCFWFAGSSLGMIALLWIVQRRFRVEPA